MLQLNRTITFILILFTITSVSFAQQHSYYPASQYRQRSPGKTSYYIDPLRGNDQNQGTSIKKPWKTFIPVNQLILSAGDIVNIVSGGSFHQSLALQASGKPDLPVQIRFAPGNYHMFPDHALAKKLHITNTNDRPDDLKSIALSFDSCSNITVTGTNTNFVIRGKMIETFINECSNIKLEGLSFDYQRPTVSELKVTHLNTYYADLLIHKDSKFSIQDSLLSFQGEGWAYPLKDNWQVLDQQKDRLSRVEIAVEKLRFVSLSQHKVRAYFPQNPGFQTNKVYQTRDVTRDCAGFFMRNSKNISLKHIRIYYMHGMGIVSQYCENILIEHFTVKPAKASGRTCAAWADILHFAGCKGLVEVSNSYLSAANDDAINVHGVHLQIRKMDKPKEIMVEFMHEQTYAFNPYSVGDSIDFIGKNTLIPIGSTVVTKATMLNEKQLLLTLKDTVPAQVVIGDAIENTTATPKVWIHDNTITRIPTRGILTTTRRNIKIEHNTLYHTQMSGILINDDAASWYESGMVRDLNIVQNNFIKCGEPVINIYPENTISATTPVHKNISVAKNTFDLLGTELFSGKSTSFIKISGNQIKMKEPVKRTEELVKLTDCQSVEIINNKVSSVK